MRLLSVGSLYRMQHNHTALHPQHMSWTLSSRAPERQQSALLVASETRVVLWLTCCFVAPQAAPTEDTSPARRSLTPEGYVPRGKAATPFLQRRIREQQVREAQTDLMDLNLLNTAGSAGRLPSATLQASVSTLQAEAAAAAGSSAVPCC